MIPAGQLNRRVQFQRKTLVADGLNQERATWADYGRRVSVRIRALSGRAAVVADQLQETITTEIVVRNIAAPVSKRWRVLWGARVLSIDAVLPLDSGDGYRLLCSEGTRDNTEGVRGA